MMLLALVLRVQLVDLEQQQVEVEAASRPSLPVVAMPAPQWILQLAQAAEEERLPLVLP